MIRKLFTTILCVLLALALPLNAVAATEYTVSVVPGDELASIEAVKDLADVLSLRLLGGEQSGMLTLAIGDTDAMSLAVRGAADGIYVQSAALAEKPLYFSRADIESFLTAMMPQDNEEATMAMKQSVEQMFTAFTVASTATQSKTEEKQTKEEIVADIRAQFANDPAMAEYIVGIVESVVTTDGEFTDAAHDPATQKSEFTITNKDLLKLADTEMMKKYMTSSDSKMTPEQAIEEYKKALENLDFNMPIAVYTADEGETLISMSMPMTMKGTVQVTKTEDGATKTELENVDIAMDISYNRLTEGAQIKHTASMSMKDEKETEMQGLLTVINDGNGNYTLDASIGEADEDKDDVLVAQGALSKTETGATGWLAMLASKTQITLDFTAAETAEGKQKSVGIYSRANAAAIIAPAAADRPMLTLNVLTKEVSEDALAAVNAATPDSSMQLLQLPQAEQETALTDITTNLMQTAFTALGLLPQSVVQLFVGTEAPAQQ